eukprot:1196228-Prorocentrum_minimum.AAC.11
MAARLVDSEAWGPRQPPGQQHPSLSITRGPAGRPLTKVHTRVAGAWGTPEAPGTTGPIAPHHPPMVLLPPP